MKGITMLIWQMFLKDVVEILLISTLVYYCLRWLARDQGQRLLFMAYGFWGVATAAWLTNCFTLFNLLLMSFPLLACAMVILHKEQLQKNYIQRPLQKTLINEPAWVDTLVRSLLHAMNEGVACAALIQKEDLLSMHVPFMVESVLTVDLFKLIMRSNEFNPTCLVWFDKRGKLLGFNASPSDDCGNRPELYSWQFDALKITQRTDACALGVNATSRSFIFIKDGKVLEGVNVHSARRLVKKYLFGVDESSNKKDESYGVYAQECDEFEKRA